MAPDIEMFFRMVDRVFVQNDLPLDEPAPSTRAQHKSRAQALIGN
jgi:hypothetical protein